MTLKTIASIKRVDMGQCMCATNCVRKYEDNKSLVESAQEVYDVPTLEDVASIKRVDMGQCMCATNCVKKCENNKSLVRTVQKVYKKVA